MKLLLTLFSLATFGAALPTQSEINSLLAQGRARLLEANSSLRNLRNRLSPGLAFTIQGRLTVQSGTPYPITDQPNAGTIYYTPYQGNKVALFNGTNWIIDTFTEQSLALSGLTANTNYDVFLYDLSNVPTLELTAWASNTARATALTTQDGVYVRSGATTRRYVGTIRTTSTTQTQDTATQRFVWNFYNRSWRRLVRTEATATWTYATTAYRATNNNSGTNLVEYVVGIADSVLPMVTHVMMSGSTQFNNVGTAYNFDTTTSSATDVARGSANDTLLRRPVAAAGFEYVSLGYHAVQWVESGNATGTTTYGGAPNAKAQAGMLGMILN